MASPHAPPPRRSRAAFWAFVVAIAVALAGGALVVRAARESVAARRGHPDSIAPAEADARRRDASRP